MAYETPTADDFRERFPELDTAELDDDTIDRYIARAMREVDETWLEDDYQEAILLHVAHRVESNSSASSAASLGLAGVGAVSLGPFSVSFRDDAGSASDFSTTSYGQAFIELRDKNIPAVVII